MNSKINQLLADNPSGTVLLSSWLVEQGYSHDLQQRYKKSSWLESISSGAFIRQGDEVDYEGAVYALQKQLHLSIHPGARSAFALLGMPHYPEFSPGGVYLFGGQAEKLPIWFKKHDWDVDIDYYETFFLPKELGLTDIKVKDFSIKVSGPARAMLECLYLAPEKQDLLECFEWMKALTDLPAKQVQTMLEKCASFKVKRLFLYLAEKAEHPWFGELQVNKIDIGKGKRSNGKDGVYIPKYEMTVPRVLDQFGKH